jgi:AraC family transcriptional regulator of adaptative response/methylated-DNA-[protein]-cysteine methyltransferase
LLAPIVPSSSNLAGPLSEFLRNSRIAAVAQSLYHQIVNESAAKILDQEACWKAVLAKDRTQDGRFFFGVATTGVYCRPGCAARTPRRENVRFYRTPTEAEADGLRPCLRCRPTSTEADRSAARIRELCEYIRANASNGQALTLDHLSRRAGLSPFHLQRMFKAAVGVTPKQFAERCRIETLKIKLRESDSVTTAVYDSGFGSSSRVYERSDSHLGMTPRTYRAGAKGVTISYASTETRLGLLMLGATTRGLCFLQFGDSAGQLLEMLRAEYPAATLQPMPEPYSNQFQLWMQSLARYLHGEHVSFDLPLDVQATAFQMKVWMYLQSIPPGATQSYAQIAAATGDAGAARAVARACASNPVAIVIPCHRVIRGDGDLGGYRWGIDRKQALLENEQRH